MTDNRKSIEEQIIDIYKPMVAEKHSDLLSFWPVISGYNSKVGEYNSWLIIVFEHTGHRAFRTSSGLGELPRALFGVDTIDNSNKQSIRRRIEKHFNIKPNDAVVFVDPDGHLGNELEIILQKHEYVMGLIPMKIFLSHKGADKVMVREFKKTFAELGFDPWLDEDAMTAGTELERGILRGFTESCAAVFFITANFKDEGYLASEVDYAIAEKRKKNEHFAIITIVFNYNGDKGSVPELLKRYVWKEPKNELDALREIIRALPVTLGHVYWRNP